MSNNITLFTTHCPQCRGVELKLKQLQLSYNEISDVTEMQKYGINSVPVLRVDDKFYIGKEIYDYLNKNICEINLNKYLAEGWKIYNE